MQNEYRETRFVRASEAPALDRAAFIRKTYFHLALALLAFVGVETALIHSSLANPLFDWMTANQYSWLGVILLMMGATWLGNAWAQNPDNVPMQYVGLGLYVAVYAVVTLPLLMLANQYAPGAIRDAAIMTGALFFGLTSTVFITRKDFSFLGPIIGIAAWVALGVIVCAILFGFTLGTLFSAVMVLLVAGCVLFTTSNMLNVYGTNQYVAASLQLFASIITMFWYILQIFMNRR